MVVKHKLKVYADTEKMLTPLSVFTETKKSGKIQIGSANMMAVNSPDLNTGAKLDFATWLSFAAPHYKISSDVKDYVLAPVIVMPSDLPNRNGVGFPLVELIKFSPDMGCQAYKTWKGKPTFYEHANTDIEKAYGVIADAFMRPMTGWSGGKLWKLLLLLAFDRSKHPEVADRVLNKDLNSFSMGAMVGSYTCSYCDAEIGKCAHLQEKSDTPQLYEKDGQLVHKNCKDIIGFETSAVETPAYISAVSDTTLILS